MKWSNALGVICDKKNTSTYGEISYSTIKPIMLHGTECQAVKSQAVK
jgi:hypothetical protein